MPNKGMGGLQSEAVVIYQVLKFTPEKSKNIHNGANSFFSAKCIPLG